MVNHQSLSFPQAIQATQTLIERIDTKEIDETDIEQEVGNIVNTKNGGRGFFVAYLTSDLSLADEPSPGIINGLKSSDEVVSELLVKNLAMSSAMAIAHGRNQDLDNVAGSQKVARRTSNLIQKLRLDSVVAELNKLQTSITDGQGEYQDFLERWEYDDEQQQAIQQAIAQVL